MRYTPLLVALLVCGYAWSNGPTPTPPVDSHVAQSHSSKTDKKSSEYQQGTEKNPLIVKRLDAEETPERRAQQSKEREEKSANEGRLIFWTWVLAIMAVVSALIAAGQLGMFWKQLGLMRDTTKNAGKAAKAALETAEVSKTMAQTDRADFFATHRPRLKVRWIYLIDDKTIQYEVTNVGQTGAEIVSIHTEISLGDLPALGPYTDKPGATVPLIHAGESREIPYVVMDDKTIAEFHLQLGWNKVIADGPHPADAKKIYFLGYISYKDPSVGIGHRTAFCRLYDYRKRRFMPMTDPDPDYEHAD